MISLKLQPVQSVVEAALKSWRIEERLSGSEWADKYYKMSGESSSEPGDWKSYAYQREPLDVMCDDEHKFVTFMKPSRIGYTKMLDIKIAYHIEHEPRSTLVVQPTDGDASDFSKEEIGPMFRDVPILNGLVAAVKAGGNTILKKVYPGGTLTIAGAVSPRSFRRLTVDNVLRDEIDGYDISSGNEGDPLKLSERRAMTSAFAKIISGSTPTVAEISKIEPLFELSDKRHFYVPCPHCGHKQILRWSGIKWPPGRPQDAYYVCEGCEKRIDESLKYEMVEAGCWIAHAPEVENHAGFFINALYSSAPGAAWGELAREFVEAKGDKLQLQVFLNTILAETWKEKGATVDHKQLYKRREFFPEEFDVPKDAYVLTCGVDTQDDRLEATVWAWGGEQYAEKWPIAHEVFRGDPGEKALWRKLEDYLLLSRFKHETGVSLRISATGVDSGGHYTTEVYKFCARLEDRRVYAVKGASDTAAPIVNNPTRKNKYKCPLYLLGVHEIKDHIFSWLNKEEVGAGFVHLPMNRDFCSEDWLEMLTNQQKVPKYKQGQAKLVYIKKGRDEPLSCLQYAFGALEILNPVWPAVKKNLLGAAEQKPVKKKVAPGKKKPPVRPKRKAPGKKPGGFITNY